MLRTESLFFKPWQKVMTMIYHYWELTSSVAVAPWQRWEMVRSRAPQLRLVLPSPIFADGKLQTKTRSFIPLGRLLCSGGASDSVVWKAQLTEKIVFSKLYDEQRAEPARYLRHQLTKSYPTIHCFPVRFSKTPHRLQAVRSLFRSGKQGLSAIVVSFGRLLPLAT